jgi:hypothetical protein
MSAKAIKVCIQCGKNCTKDQFPKKQWKLEKPSCRLCTEFTKISPEESRQCHNCKVTYPRNSYGIHQWAKNAEAICPQCCKDLQKKVLSTLDSATYAGIKTLSDGSTVCEAHSMESCDVCMMDFTFVNNLTRDRTLLGRDLTDVETATRVRELTQDINSRVCIMDGQPVCTRTGLKLKCPCMQVREGTYSSLLLILI